MSPLIKKKYFDVIVYEGDESLQQFLFNCNLQQIYHDYSNKLTKRHYHLLQHSWEDFWNDFQRQPDDMIVMMNWQLLPQ